jgi:hypothetical protein
MQWTEANLSTMRAAIRANRLYFIEETDVAAAAYDGDTLADVMVILYRINEQCLRDLCGVDCDPESITPTSRGF